MRIVPTLLGVARGNPEPLSDWAREQIKKYHPSLPLDKIADSARFFPMIVGTFAQDPTPVTLLSRFRKLQKKVRIVQALFNELGPVGEMYFNVGTDFPDSSLGMEIRPLLADIDRALTIAIEGIPRGRRAGPRDWLAITLVTIFRNEGIVPDSRPNGPLCGVMSIILEGYGYNSDETRKVVQRVLSRWKNQPQTEL